MSVSEPSLTGISGGLYPFAVALPGSAACPSEPVPRLYNGDRLNRGEFERRYSAMPEVKGAELIEGIVYMPSPVRFASHGRPHFSLITWLGLYCIRTPHVLGGDNATNRLDQDNEPQPDVVLFLPKEAGGKALVDSDGYLTGAPELVCEVSSSTVSIDMHDKLNVYRRNGVKEYLVWRVEDGAIDWFELVEGNYVPLERDEQGVVRSKTFPGLWLDVPALLNDDLAAVSATVETGVASPEHSAFNERLQAALAPKDHASPKS